VWENLEQDLNISTWGSGKTSLNGCRMLDVRVESLCGNKWNSKAELISVGLEAWRMRESHQVGDW